MAERVKKIRGERTEVGSRPARFSRGGRGDLGGFRSGDQSRSGNQAGLVTLEWIILVAAVTGIVTMALLVGWDALWDRGDEIADEGGSGHQLSAKRAAAEVDSGRACSLLNDLYDDTFEWVADTDEPGETDKCTCEINSNPDKDKVCPPERFQNANITVILAMGGDSKTIDVSTLFFSENPAGDLTYTVTDSPEASIAKADLPTNSNNITITSTDPGGTDGETAVKVKVTDSNTTNTSANNTDIATIKIRVDPDPCDVEGNELTEFGVGQVVAERVFNATGFNVTDKVFRRFFREIFKTGYGAVGIGQEPSFNENNRVASIVYAYEDPVDINFPPELHDPPDEDQFSQEYSVLVIRPWGNGTSKITLTGNYCDGDPFTITIYVGVGDLINQIPPKSGVTSPHTFDLSGYFRHLATPVDYGTPVVEGDNPGADMTADIPSGSSEITITKASGATGAVTRTITVTATDNHDVSVRQSFEVTFP